jgi:L-alanine-DL-glutamate epimerase-like enolase superfamily enzyme
MRISDVRITVFAWEAGPRTRLPGAGAHPTSGDLGLVEISTDEGVTGLSFLGTLDHPASIDAPALLRWLKPILVGADAFEREALYRAMWAEVRHAGVRSIGAVDVALWALAGKATGLPVHQLIGTARTSVPVYVSSQGLPEPSAYAAQAREVLDEGWAGYKVHPPKKTVAGDIAVAEAVRAEVGSEATLFYDGGWAYSQFSAYRIGRALEDLRYFWYEDPIAHDDIAGYVRLRRQLRLPLIATEQPGGGLQSYQPWLMHHATDALRGDVVTRGGITGMLRGARLAEAFGLNYELHYSGNGLGDAANVHVAMAMHNGEFLETPLPDPVHRYATDFDWHLDPNGCTAAPRDPGLSVQVDHDLIRRTTVAVLQ